MTGPGLPAFDAVVLAGGAARRLGGRDKMLEVVGGVRLIDRALTAVADARRVIAVGDERPTTAAAWVREEPPGGGPVAALAAGLHQAEAELAVLLAADLPFVARAHVRQLVETLGGTAAAGVMFVDRDGHDQPLLSAWRTAALRGVLPEQPAGAGLRRVLAPLDVVRLPGGADLVDCDTEADLAAARRRAEREELA